jgi:ferredoxin
MKWVIDRSNCVGHARCAAIAPEIFPLDDNGYIAVDHVDVPPEREALAKHGARACPERIIKVVVEQK